MNKRRVAACLAMVREIYGKQADTCNADGVISLWYRYLCKEPDDLVQRVFVEWMGKNPYPPKPANILGLIERAKWSEYNDALAVDLFNNESTEVRLKRIPANRLPKEVSLKSNQYQISGQGYTLSTMANVISDFDLKTIDK